MRVLKWTGFLLIAGFAIAGGAYVAELIAQHRAAMLVYEAARRHPPHPFLQIMSSAQVDHVNAQGFRGDPVEIEKPPHAFRIFTIGGSTTLGVANPYAESYPAMLQAILRERHPGVTIEVENAGSAWYTTAHDLINYQIRVRRYRPDLVIVFEAINDLTRSFSPPWWAVGDFQPDYSHYLGPYIHFMGPDVEFQHPSPWLVISQAKRTLQGTPSPFNHRDPDNVAKVAASMRAVDDANFKSLASYREYYESLIRAIQADGVTVLMASQATLFRSDLNDEERAKLYFAPLMCADHGTYPSLAAMIRGMTEFNTAARQLADRAHVTFMDFAAAVPKTLEYFTDDAHLTRNGNGILAKTAADTIDAAHLIK